MCVRVLKHTKAEPKETIYYILLLIELGKTCFDLTTIFENSNTKSRYLIEQLRVIRT